MKANMNKANILTDAGFCSEPQRYLLPVIGCKPVIG